MKPQDFHMSERFITAGQNHFARMQANLLVEHTLNSARADIAYDKYKTTISIQKPTD